MPIHIRQGGSWQTTRWHVRQGGSWQSARVHLKVNGSWEPVSSEIIDNFEDGDASEWSTQGTGTRTITSSGFDSTEYKWEHDGFSEVHLTGADAVDRGPQPGDVFEFWFRVTNTSGSVINRFEFSADSMNDNDCYRVEFERETGDNEFQIQKISGGSSVKNSTDPGHSVSTNVLYRCEIHWNAGDNNITAQIFDGDTADSNQVSISDDSSASGSEYTQPGTFIRTNDNNVCEWDELRIIE